VNARTDTLAPATLAAEQPQAQLPTMRMNNSALVMDAHNMNQMLGLAKVMASGRTTIPKHLQGNEGDCMAVVMQSMQWGMNPYSVAQKTHLINNTLGYEAQLVAAVINNSGVVKDRFHFEWFGDWQKIVGKFKEVESRTKKDDNGQPKKYIVPAWNQADEHGLGVRVWATIKGETEPRKLELLMTQARTRNSTLWTEDPKQQIAYLAQKRWARLYAPDVILGVYTPDEIDVGAPIDMGAAEVVSDWPADELRRGSEAAAKGSKEYGNFWKAMDPALREKLVKTPEHQGFKDAALEADRKRTVDTPPAAPADPPKPAAKTFDEVMAMICDAKNIDALFVAADWINAINDPAEVEILNSKYDEIKAKLEGGAA